MLEKPSSFSCWEDENSLFLKFLCCNANWIPMLFIGKGGGKKVEGEADGNPLARCRVTDENNLVISNSSPAVFVNMMWWGGKLKVTMMHLIATHTCWGPRCILGLHLGPHTAASHRMLSAWFILIRCPLKRRSRFYTPSQPCTQPLVFALNTKWTHFKSGVALNAANLK